jgi:hypothetical protein
VIARKFKSKYSKGDIRKYYPKFDVTIEALV